jgi:hypothetical protein
VKETVFRDCSQGVKKDVVYIILAIFFIKYMKYLLCFHLLFFGSCFITNNYLVMQYFTDPINHYVFRTKKSAEEYFWTNKNRKDGCSPTLSVTKKYFFDKCEDLPGNYCSFWVYFFSFAN